MSSDTPSSQPAKVLRKKAEKRKDERDSSKTTEKPETDDRRLLHELEVHQIELELQAHELLLARDNAEALASNYAELYDSSPVGYLTFNSTGHIKQSNLAAASLLATERSNLLGKRFTAFISESSLPDFDIYFPKLFASPSQPAFELELCVNGKLSTVQIETGASEDGQECRVVLTDITARKRDEIRQQLAASVFANAREGIMITDPSGIILDVNATFSKITGFSRREAIGQNPRILKSGRQPEGYYTTMWATLAEEGYWYSEVWNKRKNGEIFPEMQTISAVRNASGEILHYVSMFSDITDIKAHEHELERSAYFDPLTNLPNRARLANLLPSTVLRSRQRGKIFAVAHLDLDGFKTINDVHGDSVGDEILIEISRRLKKCIRPCDTLAHLGGDEFVVLFANLEAPRDCEPMLNRLLEIVAKEIILADQRVKLSTSIGVTVYPQDGTDPDLLLRRADQAMCLAKDTGKNKFEFFDIGTAEAIRRQQEGLQHVRRAMANNEFVLYYQPKVNMNTGIVVGAEALIRWQHPEQGILPPADFLPLIEGHLMSVTLGEWVINTALQQVTYWLELGLELPVSVNIGASQLQSDSFVIDLTTALEAHPDVRPELIGLEILETSALEDVRQVGALMRDCTDLGVSFALDDFGTGYSSLTYLKQLPVNELKIDQSFVRDMLVDPSDLAIVEAIIGLAKIFQREVTAEGVESALHGEKLLSLGCEVAQGYGIARPMPAADIPLWVKRWHAQPTWTA